MLGAAVIGLDAAESQMGRAGDTLRQIQCGLARSHAATSHARIHFDQCRQSAIGLRGSLGQRIDLTVVVNTDSDVRNATECSKTRQFTRAYRLVADQNIAHAAPCQYFGFTDFLHALAHRPPAPFAAAR